MTIISSTKEIIWEITLGHFGHLGRALRMNFGFILKTFFNEFFPYTVKSMTNKSNLVYILMVYTVVISTLGHLGH